MPYLYGLLYSDCPKLLADVIFHLIKEQCSTNRCQRREVGLKCTDLCSCNNAEEAGSCDNDADDDDQESSVVGNVDDDNNNDGDEEEEGE